MNCRVAPESYVINFTNPAGMVTEAMSRVLGDRVVGICDSPVGMFKRVSRALGVPADRAVFDYAGLNHLGWLRRVLVNGEDVLPKLLADESALRGIEEGRLFGTEWLASKSFGFACRTTACSWRRGIPSACAKHLPDLPPRHD